MARELCPGSVAVVGFSRAENEKRNSGVRRAGSGPVFKTTPLSFRKVACACRSTREALARARRPRHSPRGREARAVDCGDVPRPSGCGVHHPHAVFRGVPIRHRSRTDEPARRAMSRPAVGARDARLDRLEVFEAVPRPRGRLRGRGEQGKRRCAVRVPLLERPSRRTARETRATRTRQTTKSAFWISPRFFFKSLTPDPAAPRSRPQREKGTVPESRATPRAEGPAMTVYHHDEP